MDIDYKRKQRKKRRGLRKRRLIVARIFAILIIFLVGLNLLKSPANLYKNVEASLEKIEAKLERKPIRKDLLLVIDPGHGGIDGGAIGYNGSLEKDINLEIATKLAKNLKNQGYDILMTREEDEYIKYNYRTMVANENKADLFISIHCNSLDNNKSVKGVQVLYYPNTNINKQGLYNEDLAEIVMDSITKGTKGENRGLVPRRDVYVLSYTEMPSILIETGFITNPEEEGLLLDGGYQDKYVDSIVEGIESYFKEAKAKN